MKSMGCREFIRKKFNSKGFERGGLKAMCKVGNFLIVINIKPGRVPVYMLGYKHLWLKSVL